MDFEERTRANAVRQKTNKRRKRSTSV